MLKEGATHYEMPSSEHQVASQTRLVELTGGAVSVDVDGAVAEAKDPSPGGINPVSTGGAGGGSSGLGPKASDTTCVPWCDGRIYVCPPLVKRCSRRATRGQGVHIRR